jgi:V8-like Glu-specific endopeptidase
LVHNKILDYALIELDRKTPNRTPLKLRQRRILLSNAPLVVVGFPQGWPLKYSLNSKIRENHDENLFVINSDTFEGNSGSPVINTKNGLVEGILISGEKDFNGNQSSPPPCRTLKHCPEDQCLGENILRITSLTENFKNKH